MNHSFFCRKTKTFFKTVLIALLILSNVFNVFKLATPTFADDKKVVIVIKLIGNGTEKEFTRQITVNDYVLQQNDDTYRQGHSGRRLFYVRAYIDRSTNGQSISHEVNLFAATHSDASSNGHEIGRETLRDVSLSNMMDMTIESDSRGILSLKYTAEIRSISGAVLANYNGQANAGTTGATIRMSYDMEQQVFYTEGGTQISEEAGTQPPASEESTESTCHGTAGAIGWILCPVLEFAADAAQWAYTAVVEPSLHTNPELFQIDGERNGTYQAWGIFRNIANILFAILLLFVILSQVSGIGIDNYGIKKILPKLIVSAFLINVSFFICQALIDLSNIVGSGVYGLLTNIASGITIPEGTGSLSAGGSIALGVIGVVVAAGVGTAIGGVAFWGAIGSALLAFVPILISAVVAILFLFALLAMRQAVVVILVALSPLAFVAYTLPNTKRLFDRWSQLLRGMLLLYPICALLMAGGRLASRIIFASGAGENNLGIILTAMAAEIVPLFFIPTVVRSAYNATGHLGAALNNLHGRMVGGTRNGIRNSQRFQRANQRMQYRRAMQAANPNSGFMRRYRRASRSSNPVAQAYARWATGRAAAINQNARQLATQQGQQQALAGMNPNQIDAARNEARTNTEKQLINQANYGSAQFNAAVINEATSQADDARKRQLMWNSASYVAGKEAEALTARQNEAANAVQYGTPGYAERERLKNRAARERAAAENATWDADRVTAETTKAVEEARSQRENVLHYNDAGFAQGVRMRNEAEAEKSLHDTKNWDMDRRNAEITKGAVESDAQRANALLYNETNFASRERSKNEAETNRRREENATWSDARRDAVTHKARIESEAQRDNDLLYNDADFRVREERKHSVDTQKRQIENESWTPDRATGEVNKAKLDTDTQRRITEQYSNPDYMAREAKKADVEVQKRQIENATWTDKRAKGEVEKARVEADDAEKRARLWNNEDYAKGKRYAHREARINDSGETIQYIDRDFREGRRNEAQATREARFSHAQHANNPQYLQNQREFTEDKERRDRESAIMTQITRNGNYGGNNYGAGGKDLDALMTRFIELANKTNASQGEQDERGAIFRKLASEKQGIALLNSHIHQADGAAGHLNADGLEAMNAHRMQNADAAAALARKDTVGSMYLDDVAAGRIGTTGAGTSRVYDTPSADGTRMRTYTNRALSDASHIADQSGAALRRDVEYIPAEQLGSIVNADNFQQIIPDAGNREILMESYHKRVRAGKKETRKVKDKEGSEITYEGYEAPKTEDGRDWIGSAGSTVLVHPDNPGYTYDASTGVFSKS